MLMRYTTNHSIVVLAEGAIVAAGGMGRMVAEQQRRS